MISLALVGKAPRRDHWPSLCLLSTSACAATRGQENPTHVTQTVHPLGERLADEASRIPSLIGPNELLVTTVLLLAAIVAIQAINGAVHALWRLGIDADRRLARWVMFAKISITLLVIYALLRRFVAAAPIFSGAAIVIFAAVGLATLRNSLENLSVGIGLAFRRRFRVGDRVAVADHSGTVREIGLTSVRLRTTDATTVFVPNRLLHQHAVLVTRAENTARVSVTFRGMGELHSELVEQVRRSALLSPYRSIGTKVRVETRSDGSLEVEIQAHSSILVTDAENQLRSTIRVIIAGTQPTTPPSRM